MSSSTISMQWLRVPNRLPVVGMFWRLFTSVRFALVLISLLAAGCFLGVIVSQVPQEVGISAQDYATWVENDARPRYGIFTNLFFLLGLFDVFHTVWFRAILVLLVVAIVICTLNRFPAIYQTTIKAKPTVNDGFLRNTKNRAEFELEGGVDPLVQALRKRNFSVSQIREGEKLHLYADKFGWAKYCTFVSHLGLIMFLFGGLMTNMEGYQRFLVIPDGQSQPIYPVYHPDQMQVLNAGFTVEYYDDGRPKDYYTDLVIYKGGKEAARGRIRVNEPMDFEGFRFHQNSFGPTVQLKIQSDRGQMLYAETMTLGQSFGTIPFEIVSVPTTDISAVVALTEGNTTSNVVGGTFIRGGQETKLAVMGFQGEAMGSAPDFVMRLAPGESQANQGLKVTFEGTQFFSGVVARKDPGAIFIWIAAAMFIPAVLVTFWFARRRIWVQVVGRQVRLAGIADRYVDLQREIDELVGSLGTPSGSNPSRSRATEPDPRPAVAL